MADSKIAIYGAIAANVAIAVTKFGVAGVTGSSAMLSEGIHSAVDTFNGVLLLVGLKLSQRPATAEHPFGHGKELYFWSLIVGVLIFGLGGGISFYEGLQHIRRPQPMTDPTWNYIVLAAAAVFEGTSFSIALRQFLKQSAGRPFWRSLHLSKDPTSYTVLAEDAAALMGLLIAGCGIYLSRSLAMPELDGVASMVIGVLLAGVAVLLIGQSRGLLIGEGIRPETARDIRAMALAQPGVRSVGEILSMYIGPDDVLATIELDFAGGCETSEAAATMAVLGQAVRARYPMIKRLFIEPRTSRAGGPVAHSAAADPPTPTAN